MNVTQNLDVRLTGGVLGALAIAGAWLMLRQDNPDSTLWEISDDLEWWLAWGMLVSGLMQLVGATIPIRKLRQLGFILTSMGWFVLLGVFLMHLLLGILTLVNVPHERGERD